MTRSRFSRSRSIRRRNFENLQPGQRDYAKACLDALEHAVRSHPDFRIARWSFIIARLAQVISERKVQGGVRRVLLTQAKRLQWLAERRYQETENGGEGDSD
ncbi:hypothetical protein [Rhizobium ruizarguesonis]|uniref:hypothetical protein n=1 Tax=Rhizobium ruizarguesonis TaxID=2081791 RepID=UPI001FE10B60|nr:hypothetical protein [Rhizobium ruizarguesonis]